MNKHNLTGMCKTKKIASLFPFDKTFYFKNCQHSFSLAQIKTNFVPAPFPIHVFYIMKYIHCTVCNKENNLQNSFNISMN